MSSFAPLAAGQLAGRVALVTGAAGGIGAETVRRLVQEGVRVAAVDRSEAGLRTLSDSMGDSVLALPADLTDESAVCSLVARTVERFGALHIVVNGAGVLARTPFEQISKAEWDRVMDINLGSMFLVCRESCPHLKAAGWGRIINLASLAGQVGGVVAGAHYSASKAAAISLTRSLAKYLGPHGIRCNVIAPAGVDTPMLDEFTDPERSVLMSGIPAGRFCTPAEIAELVLWLASPATDFITGQTININGGAYFG